MNRARSLLDPAQDARLVERCLAGDERGWEALVQRHQRLVYSIARGYGLSDPELADVFQDVFIALFKGLPRLRDSRTLVRWLSSTTTRIARTVALRSRREASRAVHDPEALQSIPTADPSAWLAIETLEEQAMIRLALTSLPEPCRRLLVALYYEEPMPSYAQLAQRFRMPIGSLGPTRGRCIDRLRRILADISVTDFGISDEVPLTSPKEASEEERTQRGAQFALPSAGRGVSLAQEDPK